MRSRAGVLTLVAVGGLLLANLAGGRPVARSGGDADGADVPSPTEPPVSVQLDDDDVRVLAAAATHDPSLKGHVIADDEGLASVWRMADVAGAPPRLPPGTIVLFVIARERESTCRSTDDVVGVAIDDRHPVDGESLRPNAAVLLDRDGEFLRPCPGPSGAHAFTAFAVAIPDEYADGLGGAVARMASP